MKPNEVIAAAGPAGLVLPGVVAVALIVVVAVAVVIVRRRGSGRNTTQRDATIASSPMETPVALQNRLRHLAADLDMAMDTKLGTPPIMPVRQPTAIRPADAVPAPVPAPPSSTAPVSPVAQAPEPLRVPDDATRLFSTGDEGMDEADYTAAPAPHDATHFFGHLDEGALLSPSQTRYFSPDELTGEDDLSLDDPFSATSLLQALPPKREHDDEGCDAVAPALTHVQAYLRTVTAPAVLALSVIDGNGQVLAGATDEEIADELRALLAESGRGAQTDVQQALRFDDESHGAVFLLPTGADALLGALVRDDDLQGTRTYLRNVAIHVGETLRAAS